MKTASRRPRRTDTSKRAARELFTSHPPDGCTLAYRNLLHPTHDHAAAARQICEDLWRDFQPLSDRNFLDRFPFDFHQRWFEMYLGASLLRTGLKVIAPKPGPDFQILADGRRIHVEAVCATPGHPLHPDAVSEPDYRDAAGNPVAVRVPHDQITLRLASVFRAKRDVFDRYRRKGLVAKDEACIIAVKLARNPTGLGRREGVSLSCLLRSGKPIPRHRYLGAPRRGRWSRASDNPESL